MTLGGYLLFEYLDPSGTDLQHYGQDPKMTASAQAGHGLENAYSHFYSGLDKIKKWLIGPCVLRCLANAQYPKGAHAYLWLA